MRYTSNLRPTPLPGTKKLELLRAFSHNASTCCPAAKPTQDTAMQDTDLPDQLLDFEGLAAAAQRQHQGQKSSLQRLWWGRGYFVHVRRRPLGHACVGSSGTVNDLGHREQNRPGNTCSSIVTPSNHT